MSKKKTKAKTKSKSKNWWVIERKAGLTDEAKIVKESVTTALIKLYNFEHGAPCHRDTEMMARCLCIMGRAAEMNPHIASDDYRLRTIVGGISALNDMTEKDRFDTRQILAVDTALQNAMELYDLVTVEEVTEAYRIVKLTEILV